MQPRGVSRPILHLGSSPTCILMALTVFRGDASAADVGRPSGPNLLKNDGFEEGLKGWNASREVYQHQKAGGRTEGACLKAQNRDPKLYRLASQTIKVQPGRSYELSAWIRTENVKKGKGGGGATVCLEWGSAKRWIGGMWDKGFAGTKTWHRQALIGTIPKGADLAWVHLYLSKGATGQAWFDDVELYELVPLRLSPVILQPNYRGIIWPEERNQPILIRVDVDRSFVAKQVGKGLRLEALLGGRVAARTEVGQPGKHLVRVEAAGLEPGPWTVKVHLMADGTKEPLSEGQVEGEVWPPDKAKPRVWIDKHRRTIVNGKPFFPLGIYLGGVGKAELDPLRGTDFNTIMPYAILEPAKAAKDPAAGMRRTLDDLKARNLMLVCNLLETFEPTKGFYKRGLGGEKAGDGMLKIVVDACKDHPTLLAYYTNDELPVGLIPFLEGRFARLCGLDPNHPTWVVLNRPGQLHYYAHTTDVMGVDPYPIGPGLLGKSASLKWVGGWTRSAQQVTDGHGPVWIVPQVFNYGLYHDAATLKKSRAPTEQEMRCMTFLALAEGANGLIYYSMFDLLRDPAGFANRWKEVCAVAREVGQFTPALLSPLPAPKISLTGPGAEAVRCRAMAADEGRAVIILVNAELSPQRVELRLPRAAAEVETVIGTGKHRAGKSLTVELPANGVEVYRLAWQKE